MESIKNFILLIGVIAMITTMTILGGCSAPQKQVQPKEYVIKIESDTPVSISVYKSCKGNYNFCKWQ